MPVADKNIIDTRPFGLLTSAVHVCMPETCQVIMTFDTGVVITSPTDMVKTMCFLPAEPIP